LSDTNEIKNTLVAHQIELEKLFSKNQLLPRIRAEFQNSTEFNFVDYLTEKEIPVPFGLDLLAQMALHKRANLPTMVGLLYHHLNDAQSTADMLVKAATADLMDWSPGLKLFVVKFCISADVQEELDRFQFPLPMVVEPKPIQTNRDTGYFTGTGSVILKNGNHHEDDACLDHLNRLNSMRLTINEDVAQMVKNKWRNLDKAKEGETKEDFEKRKKAFEKYDRTAREVMKTLMEHSDHFYLTHRFDKRGRTYCMGYHVSYQAAPWNKAVICFADKEVIE
jgi:hypothetical protein